MRSNEAKDLLDLAQKIEQLAREHRAYSMVWEIIANTSDHLQAKARIVEMNAQGAARTGRTQAQVATSSDPEVGASFLGSDIRDQ